MKAVLINTTAMIQWSPRSSKCSGAKPRFASCLRLEGQGNADISQSSNGEETKQSEIWRLFKEAQQNILYMNKQRRKAMEELHRVNEENRFLLDKVEQLEEEKQAVFGKDRLSLCWELLLRIDSLTLTGLVTTREASDLRRLIMDHRISVDDVFTDTEEKNDVEFLAALRHFSDRSKKYVSLNLDEVQGLCEIGADSYSYFNGQLQLNRIWTGVVCGIGVTLIEPQYYSAFFDRERVYGYSDDFERFSYFSRASLDYIIKSGKQPDVLNIHNWETAIVGPLFWDIFANQGLEGTRILLTCHNFNQQCLEQPGKLELCGLDPARLHRPDRLQDDNKSHLVNILKGGVVYSNKVVIMSSIHSKSKVIHSLSYGLETTLNIHKDKLVVSPSGFDSFSWDPLKDNFLPENYSVDDMEGKNSCKVALQQYVELPESSSNIVVGCIVSEVSNVDLENLKSIVWSTVGSGVQFVIVGDSNMPDTNRVLKYFQEQLMDEDIRFVLGHEEALLHLIFAGSDIILCQSFHDPVFQVPFKALRYGAALIALTSNSNRFRNFVDHDHGTTKFARFVSSTYGTMSISEALGEIKNNPSKWKRKIMEGMAMDFSWDGECCDIHVSAYESIKNL